MKKFIIGIFAILFFALPAFAYLDPSSGSMMLQAVLAVVASVYVVIKVFYSKIKSFFIWKK